MTRIIFIGRQVEYHLPKMPNYILGKTEKDKIHVSNLSLIQVEAIAEEMKKGFIEHCKKIREKKWKT